MDSFLRPAITPAPFHEAPVDQTAEKRQAARGRAGQNLGNTEGPPPPRLRRDPSEASSDRGRRRFGGAAKVIHGSGWL